MKKSPRRPRHSPILRPAAVGKSSLPPMQKSKRFDLGSHPVAFDFCLLCLRTMRACGSNKSFFSSESGDCRGELEDGLIFYAPLPSFFFSLLNKHSVHKGAGLQRPVVDVLHCQTLGQGSYHRERERERGFILFKPLGWRREEPG